MTTNQNFKQTTKLSIDGATLDVLGRTGKNGLSVFVRVRETGQKAETGARSVFLPANVDGAKAHFDGLVKDALAKGWVLKTTNLGNASKFASIPSATDITARIAARPAVAVASKPVAVKVAGKGK